MKININYVANSDAGTAARTVAGITLKLQPGQTYTRQRKMASSVVDIYDPAGSRVASVEFPFNSEGDMACGAFQRAFDEVGVWTADSSSAAGAAASPTSEGGKDTLLRENRRLSTRVSELEGVVEGLKGELERYTSRVDTWTIEFSSPQVPRRARGQLSELIQRYTDLSDHQVSQMFRSWGQRRTDEAVQLDLRASRDVADHLSTEMQRITTIPLRVVPVATR